MNNELAAEIGSAYLMKVAGEISDEEFEDFAQEKTAGLMSAASYLYHLPHKLRMDKIERLNSKAALIKAQKDLDAADDYVPKVSIHKWLRQGLTGEKLRKGLRGHKGLYGKRYRDKDDIIEGAVQTAVPYGLLGGAGYEIHRATGKK